ncbi:MAG: M48 family metalloprotease, partial [Methylocystis sp.]
MTASPLVRRTALSLLAIVGLAIGGCAELERQGQIFTAPLPPTRPTGPRTDNRSTVQHKELVAQFGGEYEAPGAEHY